VTTAGSVANFKDGAAATFWKYASSVNQFSYMEKNDCSKCPVPSAE
jgi:hypothetical protein